MNLIVLSLASILWGAMLWGGGLLAQRYGEADGAARQLIWRLAAMLLIAPWIIAPVGILFGLKGPAPAPIMLSAEPALSALAGLVLLGEQLHLLQWLAVACVIAASIGSASAATAEPPAIG